MIFIFIVSHFELKEDFSQCQNESRFHMSFSLHKINYQFSRRQSNWNRRSRFRICHRNFRLVNERNDWLWKCPITRCRCWFFSSSFFFLSFLSSASRIREKEEKEPDGYLLLIINQFDVRTCWHVTTVLLFSLPHDVRRNRYLFMNTNGFF